MLEYDVNKKIECFFSSNFVVDGWSKLTGGTGLSIISDWRIKRRGEDARRASESTGN